MNKNCPQCGHPMRKIKSGWICGCGYLEFKLDLEMQKKKHKTDLAKIAIIIGIIALLMSIFSIILTGFKV